MIEQNTSDKKVAEYRKAFEMVCDATNWKNPVYKVIAIASDQEKELIKDAIIWFTGSVPHFEKLSSGRTLVTAVGYYIAIGA